MTDRQAWKEKVTKLLAKAESTESVEEAEIFNAKAQELMLRWAIEEVELENVGTTKREIPEDRYVKVPNPYAKGRLQLLHVIALRNRCRTYFIPDRRHKTAYGIKDHHINAHVVGFPSDIDRVEIMFESLSRQLDTARQIEYQAYAANFEAGAGLGSKKVWSASFMRGFSGRVGGRLAQVNRDMKEEITESTALVLVDKQKTVDEFYAAMGMRSDTSNQQTNLDGVHSGRAAGNRAVLGGELE